MGATVTTSLMMKLKSQSLLGLSSDNFVRTSKKSMIYSKQLQPFLLGTLTMTAMVNMTIGTRVNLIYMVITIKIGLQPMTKMTVKMMSMKKMFTEDIMVLLGIMLMIIRSIV